MNDDIRRLEKIILNMKPNGILQNQIVDAFKSILCIAKQWNSPSPSEVVEKLAETPQDEIAQAIKKIKEKDENSSNSTLTNSS